MVLAPSKLITVKLTVFESNPARERYCKWGHGTATSAHNTMHAVWVHEKANSTCG